MWHEKFLLWPLNCILHELSKNIWHMGSMVKLNVSWYLWHVTCVTCDMKHMLHATFFTMTIELYFAWAFQKYITHWTFGKLVCKLIFLNVTYVTCDMLHMWHVTFLSWPLNCILHKLSKNIQHTGSLENCLQLEICDM